ncbi:MAG: heparinase II/III domain-containing protein, partial [Bacilli bacterium]
MKTFKRIFVLILLLISTPSYDGLRTYAKVSTIPREAVLTVPTLGVSPITISNKLLTGELYVREEFKALPYKFPMDWRTNPFPNNNSYPTYLHSLNMISFLASGYENNPNPAYLQLGKKIILDWQSQNVPVAKAKHKYAWYDATVANRTIALNHFWYVYAKVWPRDVQFNKTMEKLLSLHAMELYKDANYSFNDNHGIYQDRALLTISYFWPQLDTNLRYRTRAMERILDQLKFQVSPTGVHREHSPSYQNLVIQLFKSIRNYLALFGTKEPKLDSAIYNMESVYAQFITPTFKLPPIGDSNHSDLRTLDARGYDKNSHPYYKYILSLGKDGTAPPLDFADIDGGYVIWRDWWNEPKSSYFLLTTAAHSTTHKHADDLSFFYEYDGVNWFTDGGKYLYGSDPFRSYFVKGLSHNVIAVDNQMYDIKDSIGNTFIDQYDVTDTYKFARAHHTIYPGVTITRSFLYVKESQQLLIWDEATSESEHTYSQLFNLGIDVKSSRKSPSKWELTHAPSSKKLGMTVLSGSYTTYFYDGLTNPIRGFASPDYLVKKPIQQLEFSK